LPRVGDEGISRRTVLRQTHADTLSETPHGKVLVDVPMPLKGSEDEFQWAMVNPFALLHYYCSSSPRFEEFLLEILESNPCTAQHPWHITLYADEATPGNVLSIQPSRKSWCFYWSFDEFGQQVLSSEHGWLLAGVLRTSIASAVDGGLSNAFRLMMRAWFIPGFFGLGQRGISFSTGVSIRTKHGVKMLLANLSMTLADEAALAKLYGSKSASGLKICLVCQNIFASKSGLTEDSDDMVASSDLDVSHWRMHTKDL
jgi:hypothetical protein